MTVLEWLHLVDIPTCAELYLPGSVPGVAVAVARPPAAAAVIQTAWVAPAILGLLKGARLRLVRRLLTSCYATAYVLPAPCCPSFLHIRSWIVFLHMCVIKIMFLFHPKLFYSILPTPFSLWLLGNSTIHFFLSVSPVATDCWRYFL